MAADEDATLRLVGVGKRFGRGTWVLREVDLALHNGEVVVFSGPNGVGKSTLLRLTAGASRPSTGTVVRRRRRLRGAVRYVPDRVGALDRMPAAEYVRRMGQLQGLAVTAAARRAEEILDRLGFVGEPSQPIRYLSKGNAQKVQLAQAWLTPADLLVLDEPGAALDTAAREALSLLIVEAANAGSTVALSDHIASIAASVGTRHLLVEGGSVHPANSRSHKSRATVVLTANCSSPLDWVTHPGVASVHTTSDGVQLRVDGPHVDGVLRRAIDAGWSVERVHRDG